VHDGSNDADSRNGVPFLGFVDTAPHLGVKSPQNPNFGGVNTEQAFSSQTCEIEKHAYYQNYCTDSNQILYSDKDHQMPSVGDPNTHVTNPRWRTIAILEKSKNRHISATVGPIATKFGMMTQFDPLDHSVWKIGPQ